MAVSNRGRKSIMIQQVPAWANGSGRNEPVVALDPCQKDRVMNPLRFSLVRLAIVLLPAAVLLLVRQPVQAQPENTTYYAAIAFSEATGKYGYSSGWLSDLNAR